MPISFLHSGNESMASYRYRAQIPARELGASIGDLAADVLIFTKPIPQDIDFARIALEDGRKVIVDFCDMHFGRKEYQRLLKEANEITCPTQWFQDFLKDDYGVSATIVHDPYEFDEAEPHCAGDNLLWFGHGSNIDSLGRIAGTIDTHPLIVVSNVPHTVQYSRDSVLEAMRVSDIVIMPETAPYKSCNRTVEAIRRGCFVVAEPHPAINGFPGIWIGSIKEGVEWAKAHQQEANEKTKTAQEYIRKWYAPSTQADAWRIAIRKAQSFCTLVPERLSGMGGSTSMDAMNTLTLKPMLEASPFPTISQM